MLTEVRALSQFKHLSSIHLPDWAVTDNVKNELNFSGVLHRSTSEPSCWYRSVSSVLTIYFVTELCHKTLLYVVPHTHIAGYLNMLYVTSNVTSVCIRAVHCSRLGQHANKTTVHPFKWHENVMASHIFAFRRIHGYFVHATGLIYIQNS